QQLEGEKLGPLIWSWKQAGKRNPGAVAAPGLCAARANLSPALHAGSARKGWKVGNPMVAGGHSGSHLARNSRNFRDLSASEKCETLFGTGCDENPAQSIFGGPSMFHCGSQEQCLGYCRKILVASAQHETGEALAVQSGIFGQGEYEGYGTPF